MNTHTFNEIVKYNKTLMDTYEIDEIDTNVHINSIDTPIIKPLEIDTNIPIINQSIFNFIKPHDEDTSQRINVGFQFIFELYRVVTSSLLILFVPQLCKDHICTINENLVWETKTYNTAICFNFISMVSLVSMYYLELIRENRLIKFLRVNKNFPNNNKDVGERLELLPIKNKKQILNINRHYKLISYSTIVIYSVNVILSGIVVNNYYAGTQTTSTFITYVLFIASKFTNVYSLISSDINILYSAYMKSNIQFNDVDIDFIKIV